MKARLCPVCSGVCREDCLKVASTIMPSDIIINTGGFHQDIPFIAVEAINRQVMVDLLNRCVGLQRYRGREIYGFVITMPCGSEMQFIKEDDIPFDDLPCPCGRADHYVIKYEESLNDRRTNN